MHPIPEVLSKDPGLVLHRYKFYGYITRTIGLTKSLRSSNKNITTVSMRETRSCTRKRSLVPSAGTRTRATRFKIPVELAKVSISGDSVELVPRPPSKRRKLEQPDKATKYVVPDSQDEGELENQNEENRGEDDIAIALDVSNTTTDKGQRSLSGRTSVMGDPRATAGLGEVTITATRAKANQQTAKTQGGLSIDTITKGSPQSKKNQPERRPELKPKPKSNIKQTTKPTQTTQERSNAKRKKGKHGAKADDAVDIAMFSSTASINPRVVEDFDIPGPVFTKIICFNDIAQFSWTRFQPDKEVWDAPTLYLCYGKNDTVAQDILQGVEDILKMKSTKRMDTCTKVISPTTCGSYTRSSKTEGGVGEANLSGRVYSCWCEYVRKDPDSSLSPGSVIWMELKSASRIGTNAFQIAILEKDMQARGDGGVGFFAKWVVGLVFMDNR